MNNEPEEREDIEDFTPDQEEEEEQEFYYEQLEYYSGQLTL